MDYTEQFIRLNCSLMSDYYWCDKNRVSLEVIK